MQIQNQCKKTYKKNKKKQPIIEQQQRLKEKSLGKTKLIIYLCAHFVILLNLRMAMAETIIF